MKTLTTTEKVDLLKVLFNNGNIAICNDIKIRGIDFDSIDANGKLKIKLQDFSELEVLIDEIKISDQQRPTQPKRIYVPDCAWDKNPLIHREYTHYEISSSHGYGNSRHSKTFDNLEDAVKFAKNKFHLPESEHAEYWDKQDEIITKVTTISEIVRVVKSAEKE